jgi:choline kinase
MNSLTVDRPKCLQILRGQTLLSYQEEALKQLGVDQLGIVTGYLRQTLQMDGWFEFHNARWEQTNMVSSLMCASDWLRNDTCIVSYSDIFYFGKNLRPILDAPGDVVVAYDPDWSRLWSMRFQDPLDDAETFRVNENSVIEEIGLKATGLSEIEGQYMGIVRFSPHAWSVVQDVCGRVDDLDRLQMTQLLQLLVGDERIDVRAWAYTGIWGEVDHESDLRLYESSQFDFPSGFLPHNDGNTAM